MAKYRVQIKYTGNIYVTVEAKNNSEVIAKSEKMFQEMTPEEIKNSIENYHLVDSFRVGD